MTIPLTTEFYILTITTTTNLTHLTVFETSVLFGGGYIHEAFPTILNGISRYRILDIGYWISDIAYRISDIGYRLLDITGGSMFTITSPDDFVSLSSGDNLEVHLLAK